MFSAQRAGPPSAWPAPRVTRSVSHCCCTMAPHPWPGTTHTKRQQYMLQVNIQTVTQSQINQYASHHMTEVYLMPLKVEKCCCFRKKSHSLACVCFCVPQLWMATQSACVCSWATTTKTWMWTYKTSTDSECVQREKGLAFTPIIILIEEKTLTSFI